MNISTACTPRALQALGIGARKARCALPLLAQLDALISWARKRHPSGAAYITIRYSRLAQLAGYSRRHTIRLCRLLEDAGVIRITRRWHRQEHRQQSNLYGWGRPLVALLRRIATARRRGPNKGDTTATHRSPLTGESSTAPPLGAPKEARTGACRRPEQEIRAARAALAVARRILGVHPAE